MVEKKKEYTSEEFEQKIEFLCLTSKLIISYE